MILRYGETKKRSFQKQAGLFFGFSILISILSSLYVATYSDKLLEELNYSREIRAKNTLFDANRIYIMHGVKIEYFDFNKTKTIYSPTKEYEKLRRTLVWQKNELNRHPTYLMIGFLLIALAFYLSTILAERAMKK